MEEPDFLQQATLDSQLQTFLQAVADEVRASTDLANPQQYSIGGADILPFLAATALYRWAKDTLDYRRQLQQTQVLEQQAEIVASLIKDGLPAKDAQAIVTTLMKKIAERPRGCGYQQGLGSAEIGFVYAYMGPSPGNLE